MAGLITEKDWDAIEAAFPGIFKFYQKLAQKQKTFLELQWAFQKRKL